jgi:hypothetical protein
MAAYYRRLTRPDASDASIARLHVGRSAAQVVAENHRYAIEGVHAEFGSDGPPVPGIESVDVDGRRATVRACFVDDVRLVRDRDRRQVNGVVASKVIDARLVLVSGRWKLAEQRLVSRLTGAEGCR